MVKIAVASTDGKMVNQHFGKADRFYILETDEDSAAYRLAEIRRTTPVCSGRDHESGQMEEAVKRLSDCDIVLVSRVGMRAKNELENAGIEAFEVPGVIDEVIDRVICYRKVQSLFV